MTIKSVCNLLQQNVWNHRPSSPPINLRRVKLNDRIYTVVITSTCGSVKGGNQYCRTIHIWVTLESHKSTQTSFAFFEFVFFQVTCLEQNLINLFLRKFFVLKKLQEVFSVNLKVFSQVLAELTVVYLFISLVCKISWKELNSENLVSTLKSAIV